MAPAASGRVAACQSHRTPRRHHTEDTKYADIARHVHHPPAPPLTRQSTPTAMAGSTMGEIDLTSGKRWVLASAQKQLHWSGIGWWECMVRKSHSLPAARARFWSPARLRMTCCMKLYAGARVPSRRWDIGSWLLPTRFAEGSKKCQAPTRSAGTRDRAAQRRAADRSAGWGCYCEKLTC